MCVSDHVLWLTSLSFLIIKHLTNFLERGLCSVPRCVGVSECQQWEWECGSDGLCVWESATGETRVHRHSVGAYVSVYRHQTGASSEKAKRVGSQILELP